MCVNCNMRDRMCLMEASIQWHARVATNWIPQCSCYYTWGPSRVEHWATNGELVRPGDRLVKAAQRERGTQGVRLYADWDCAWSVPGIWRRQDRAMNEAVQLPNWWKSRLIRKHKGYGRPRQWNAGLSSWRGVWHWELSAVNKSKWDISPHYKALIVVQCYSVKLVILCC